MNEGRPGMRGKTTIALSIIFLVGCDQKKAHQLTATEELGLRTKCVAFGQQLEKAKKAEDATLEQQTEDLENLTLKPQGHDRTSYTNLGINYNIAKNRCYALDKERRATLSADGSVEERLPMTVLYDAQTQEKLAQIWTDASGKKHGRIMGIDSAPGADDYNAAKKFISERMGDEAR